MRIEGVAPGNFSKKNKPKNELLVNFRTRLIDRLRRSRVIPKKKWDCQEEKGSISFVACVVNESVDLFAIRRKRAEQKAKKNIQNKSETS